MPDDLTTLNILVAEDDADISRMIVRYLTSLGHNVRSAARSDDAWNMLVEEPVAVIDGGPCPVGVE